MSERAFDGRLTMAVSQPVCSELQGASAGAGIRLRWLGVAGLEVAVDDQILIIDPYVTRLSVWRVVWGRVASDHRLVGEVIPACDYLFITHAHWDHLMDVPEVACRTGAHVYGSSNACYLSRICGVSGEQVHEIGVGDELVLGPFRVEVIEAQHWKLLGKRVFAGDLPSKLCCPPRVTDYRMDTAFSFLIQTGPFRVLDWSSESTEAAVPADVLCVKPFQSRAFFENLLATVRPRIVIPVHWDNFFRPLSRPSRPLAPVVTPRHLSRSCCGNPNSFQRMVAEIVPTAHVMVPDALCRIDLDRALAPSS